MTSLRKQLLTWLLPSYLLAAVVATLCTYFMFGVTVAFFMDNQLRVFAESLADSTGPTPAMRPLTAHSVDKGDLVAQIWDRDGRLLTSSWPALALPRQPTEGFHDLTIGSLRWRVYSLHSPDRTVQSAQCLNFRDMVIRSQALQAGLPVALLIPISAVILWLVIRIALRRLEVVAKAAAAQDEHSLGELPLEHVPTEIRPLVLAVNALLSRLRDAFSSQRRFVQDAAHELRTPITALSLQLENLKTCVTDNETAQQVAQFEAGLARTKRLVEQLLRLARQEAPRNPDPPATLQLDVFLKDVIAELMPLADHRGIDLGFAASISATVNANADELRSLLHNLLDNALRYAPRGGIVDIALHNDTGVVTVEIIDNGPGIPPDLLPRVFDRFFRVEGSDTEGSGLGLAIAKHAAERNRVELALRNRIDGTGLIATVRFGASAVSQANTAALHMQPLTTQIIDPLVPASPAETS